MRTVGNSRRKLAKAINRCTMERLETRQFLSAVPTILSVTDGVAANQSFTLSGSGIDGTDVAVAAEPKHGALEADFNGAGAGMNGATDLVTSGGTGMLGSSGITNSIVTTSPFGDSGGSYLQSTVTHSASPPSSTTVATFTPSSAATSWNAITGTATHGSVSYLTLNGGFDLFVRADTQAAGNYSWFRPIDLSTISGATGMRLIFNGDSGGQAQLEIATGGTALSTTSATSFTLTQVVLSASPTTGSLFATNSIEHVGFTFSTDLTGLITMKIFAVADTGAIDTTSSTNLIGSKTFYANAATIGSNHLPAGAWSMTNRYGSTTQDTRIDYDAVRFYSTTPATFAGLSVPGTAVHPTIEQTSATAAHNPSIFATALLPSGSAAGIYDIWAKNSSGWSSFIRMNQAAPTYMSDNTAYAGIKIELVGRNMDQAEFGGSIAPQVRLNDGNGNIVNQTISAYNPYDVTFTASGTASATPYFVEESNDGGNTWSRLNDGQQLTIVNKITGGDPLGLGVTWAQNFNWSNTVNVQSYGATGNYNTSSNDTTAIKNAIAALNTSGGGVLLFPTGDYYATGFNIPSNVVLEGATSGGVNQATIYYIGTTRTGTFIGSSGGTTTHNQGIANLNIQLLNPNVIADRPDGFINIGGSGLGEADRGASQIFVYGVDLTYPLTGGDADGGDGRRGIGLQFNARDHVLVANNQFVGYEATLDASSTNQYAIIRNNTFNYSSGYVNNTAQYAFFEGNVVDGNAANDLESHGLDGRADSYYYNNTILNEGSADPSDTYNDGEAIFTDDPHGQFNSGTVTSATPTSITVNPTADAVTIPDYQFGELDVMINSGTGVGQLMAVTTINSATNTINLSSPFTILPDATSTFTLYTPCSNMIVYDNTASDCAKGIWCSGGYNNVVADNTLTNCRGILMTAVEGTGVVTPNYFGRITGNTMTGVSARSGYVGVTINGSRNGLTGFNFVQQLGISVTDNSITGIANPTHPSGSGEAGNQSGIALNVNGITDTGDIVGTIIEINVIHTVPVAFTLTEPDDGQLFRDNQYGTDTLESDPSPSSTNSIFNGNTPT